MTTNPVTQWTDIYTVDPNPYQQRAENHARAVEIAASIARQGLLQYPTGRWIDDGARVQLAAGHTRLAAYKLLHERDPIILEQYPDLALLDFSEYSHIPITIRPLTDEQLFEALVTENDQRDDLTPIEVAREMIIYRDQFGKSSREIGLLFGLSDSAVRNLMRLLDLPAEPREALEAGRMSQGAARVWLSLDALPAAFLKRTEHAWPEELRPSHIRKDALAGFLASGLDDRVTRLITREGLNLSIARFKKAEIYEGRDIFHPDCKTCPAKAMREKSEYCLVRDCFNKKHALWRAGILMRASEILGLPQLSLEKSTDRITNFDYFGREKVLENARGIQCPNLCLHYNSNMRVKIDPHLFPDVKNFPDVIFVCSKMEQHCTCLNAHRAGIRIVSTHPNLPEPNPEKPFEERFEERDDNPTSITVEELKGVKREIASRKKQAREITRTIRETASKQFYNALSGNDLRAWQELMSHLYDFGGADDAQTVEDLFLRVAASQVERQFKYEQNADTDLELTQRRLDKWLKDMGLPGMTDPVSTETPDWLTANH